MNKLDQAEIMKRQTKQFAIRIVNVVPALPSSREGNVLGNQPLEAVVRRLRRIIALFAGHDPRPSLSPG